MAVAVTTYEHIALDDEGVPVIIGANTKVVELVDEMVAYGWSPAEMAIQHPHLSLGQIHSALAYYWDHREEIDADRKRRFQETEELRSSAGASPVAEKLLRLSPDEEQELSGALSEIQAGSFVDGRALLKELRAESRP